MKKFNYTIKDPNGVHARPAAVIVTEAKKYASNVFIIHGQRSADAKKLFAVMALGAQCGDELIFEFDGSDEASAYDGMIVAVEKARL